MTSPFIIHIKKPLSINQDTDVKTPNKKSFSGRISKKTAQDLNSQLKEMRNEWERI